MNLVPIYSYSLNYFAPEVSTQELLTRIDDNQRIPFWYYCMPGSVFLNANADLQYLQGFFDGIFKRELLHRYFIAAINPMSCQGWMPPQLWYMINNPQNPVLPDAFVPLDPSKRWTPAQIMTATPIAKPYFRSRLSNPG